VPIEILGEYLFNGSGHLRDRLEAALQDAVKKVDQLSKEELEGKDTGTLVGEILTTYQHTTIALQETKTNLASKPCEIDVTGSPFRAPTGRRMVVPGKEYCYSVPFTGNPKIFSAQTSTSTTSKPMAEVRNGKLLYCFRVADDEFNADGLDTRFKEQLNTTKQYMAYANQEIEQYDKRFAEVIPDRIEGRRARLLKDKEELEKLRSKL
jgi:hypothetical protein